MKKLGISVYIDQAPLEDILSYIQTAAKYGFTRMFTCLISLEGEQWERFKTMCLFAKEKNIDVIADVDPSVFEAHHLSWKDLGFFSDLGLSGIRLDLGFSGAEEAFMSQNPYNLFIELNMSAGTKYVDNIMSYQANRERIIGCHNFYPHVYTGLSRQHFLSCSKQFKEKGIRTAAFVNAHSARYGPWPVSEGLCTLEEHRSLPIEVQAKDLFNTQLIDDVIIANMFASEEEMRTLGALNKDLLVFNVELVESVPELERVIVLEEPHFNRGDVSDYLIRSTQSRITYKGRSFPVFNTPNIQKGDIIIESDLYTRYAGELQIAKRDMPNSGRSNVVGRIVEEELYLLDALRPWQAFGFKEK